MNRIVSPRALRVPLATRAGVLLQAQEGSEFHKMFETDGASGARPIREFQAPSLPAPPLDLLHHAIFTDFDGTLVEIAARPDLVVGDPELIDLLISLGERLSGALALVTGRTAGSADRILQGAVPHIAGLHGAEFRLGPSTTLLAPDAVAAAMGDARAAISETVVAGELNVVVEDKGLSLALHFRHAPESEQQIHKVALALAGKHGLRLLRGKMVVELMPVGINKGGAVAEFMRYPPFSGRTPVAIGDDLTDEDAFEAAREFGGYGVLVGTQRPSAATYHLPDVAAVRAWLAGALGLVYA